ncbi:MAG TPA: hypothetical protein PLH57_04360 [Oligoflexia bacterium]|nr:hypothetical protein [Oligoflexia bacterium]
MGLKRFTPIFFLTLFGCSFKPLPEGLSNKLTIFLKDNTQTAALTSLTRPPFAIQAPTSTTDFDCFAVNITGDGVLPDSEQFQGCSINGGAGVQSFGFFSEPFKRSSSISVEIPAGDARRIDVYGIYPSTGILECGGSMGGNGDEAAGYYVGSSTINLTASTSVSIPISFASGTTAALDCEGDGHAITYTAQVNGSNAAGRYWNSCGDAALVDSTDIPPITSTAFAGAENTAVSSNDATSFNAECDYVGINFNVTVNEYAVYADLTTIQTYYDRLTIYWTGSAGIYSTPCDSSSSPTGAGSGATPRMEVYNDSTSTWESITTVGTTETSITHTITNPANYYDPATNAIWFRVVGGVTNGASTCSVVKTNQVYFTFDG